MANLWDNLDSSQQNALVKAHVAHNGGSTPENVNRAREQLAANPNLVKRLAKETGLESEDEDAVVQDEEDVGEEISTDQAISQTLEDSGSMSDTGDISQTLPPPEEGEDVQDYYTRLTEGLESNPTMDSVGRSEYDQAFKTKRVNRVQDDLAIGTDIPADMTRMMELRRRNGY